MTFLIALAGIGISLFSAMLAAIGTYLTLRRDVRKERQEDKEKLISAAKKEYAAERDFAHLQRDYQQLQQNLTVLMDETDERFDNLENELKTVTGMLHVMLLKSGETETGILRKLSEKRVKDE